MQFRSLQSRIVTLFALLLLVVQIAALILIDAAVSSNAKDTARQELAVAERMFARLLKQDSQKFLQAAGVLAADYGFRQAVATNDRETIVSVLNNHGARVKASAMMLIAMDRSLIADTSSADPAARKLPFPEVLDAAEKEGQASAIVLINGQPNQLVVVPVLAPGPIAWVAMGFAIDDRVADDLKSLMAVDVSFLIGRPNNDWQVLATTVTPDLRSALIGRLRSGAGQDLIRSGTMALPGNEIEFVASQLGTVGNGTMVAILQRSLRDAMTPFHQLRATLLGLAIASLLASVIGSMFLARSITRPVSLLVGAVRKIEEGDYSTSVKVRQNDEIGDLATAFNRMREGISAREKEIFDLAYSDSLTGLPNRVLFGDRLQQAISSAKRAQHPLSILLIDLDRFKHVNDTLGHPAGDLLLREVGVRLRAALPRKSDTLARLGGDEFSVLLPTDDATAAAIVATRLLAALNDPIVIEGHPVDIGGSIGIASCPAHGEDAATLMRRVDVAMYAAKRNNSGPVAYDTSFESKSADRLSLLGELRQAVAQNQLVLYYQPKVDMAGRVTRHVEALVRWQHPERGFVPPDQFIPFAEQTGYIRAITRWVVAEAFRQCRDWQTAGLQLGVAVNISARDLFDSELVSMFVQMLAVYEVAPAWISLEITESAIMDDPEKALKTVQQLHDIGFNVCIDDFGTGYSSLGYLKKLPVDELKIDRTFVKNMAKDRDDATIVRSTIDLGHNLGLKLVAEGVEDRDSYDLLGKLGCDYAQGYFMSRPLSAAQLQEWLRESEWAGGAGQGYAETSNVVVLPEPGASASAPDRLLVKRSA